MTRLLVLFGLFEGAAFATFLFAPLPMEERVPANLLPWALACAAFFFAVVWPAVEAGLAREEGEGALGPVLERGALLLGAVAPFAASAAALAPPVAGDFLRAAAPAAACLVAGALGSWAARLAGPAFARAACAAGLAAFLLGPIGRFLSGAAGSFPGEPVTVVARPWLAAAAAAFPVAALLARRLRQGGAEPEGEA